MYTDTKNKILAYIKENNGTSAKNIISQLGLNAAGVFRHLKKMQDTRQIYKLGKPPHVRYYAFQNMEQQSKLFNSALNWAISGNQDFSSPDQLCPARDVFQARTDRLIRNLKKSVANENLVYLLAAMAGEIGNNSFDHNIGQWKDVTGNLFAVDEAAREIIIADRGQGILSSLRRVRPSLVSAAEALRVAFTEIISGRAPEKRGNGLKFVKKVVMENNLCLIFYSGNAVAEINAQGLTIKISSVVIPGALSYLRY